MATFLRQTAGLVAFIVVFGSVGAFQMPRSLVGENIFTPYSSAWSSLHPNTALNVEVAAITESITQRVDNFDLQNNATFEQRFYRSDPYFRANGPIYLMLFDTDLRIFTYIWDDVLISDAARSEGGLLVGIETRYFGESIPTADLSVANLRFLTVEQTLADIAHFVVHLRATTPGATATTPVIVSGIGVGGSLAVWFRQRYPHLAAGVWGHGAPLQVLRDNRQHGANVFNALRRIATTPACFAVIAEGSRGLEALADAGKLDVLSEHLRLCEPLRADRPERVQYLFYLITTQYSYMTVVPELLRWSCDGLVKESHVNGSTAALALYVRRGFLSSDDIPEYDPNQCLNLYAEESDLSVRYERLDGSSYRRYLYHRCTQLGWFSTSSNGSLFKTQVPLSMFTDYCKDVFGDAVATHQIAQENQNRFNTEHGGLTPHITNAVFTLDVNDPFLTLGVRAHLSETALLYIVENQDAVFFRINQDVDDNKMIDLKQDILTQIRSWSRT